MFEQLQGFFNLVIVCVSIYIIYQAYLFRKILLIVGIVAILGYVAYLLYTKNILTNKIQESTTELKQKNDEILQIKKTIADEEFNNTKSLGYSLNNPGNIRKSSTKFKGEIESNGEFKKFKTMKYGFRAMTSLLHTYIKNGHNTVYKILIRYAPTGDGNNNPSRYTNSVIKLANVKSNQTLSTPDFKNGNMLNIMYAMTKVEQGYVPNIHDLHEGYMMYVKEIDIQPE